MISSNVSLKKYNTFGIEVLAKGFASFSSVENLHTLIDEHAQFNYEALLILGGGSNVLFTHNFNGLVLKNNIDGIKVMHDDDTHVLVQVGAGVNWHAFVLHCIENNWAGVENLSLIPGNVGASPLQNIGAYGVELKDVFYALDAFHLYEKTTVKFTRSDCAFGYRESVFKGKFKNQFVITSVTFKLNKTPIFNISYGAIAQALELMKISTLSIKAISDAVISIRQSKLPDPAIIGNAGSFFKNPTIAVKQYEHLKADYPEMPGYFSSKDDALAQVKIPAGWLIEQCGYKGFRKGDAGVYKLQALVLVNYGQATGFEIFELSTEIIASVLQRFGIGLEREVNVI